MEHSLYTYLANQSIFRLENLLLDIRSGAMSGNYGYMIPMIEEILSQKKELLNN